jgi:hypothetical protein
MANAKCPKCGKAIAKLMIESIAATLDGKDKTIPAVVFSCGSCRSVLSMQVDPVSVTTDTVRRLTTAVKRQPAEKPQKP